MLRAAAKGQAVTHILSNIGYSASMLAFITRKSEGGTPQPVPEATPHLLIPPIYSSTSSVASTSELIYYDGGTFMIQSFL